MRVVLYAEGASELAGAVHLLPRPGGVLADDHLGPAHLLVRRCLDPLSLRFESPLHTSRGLHARGTALYHPRTLRQLLTWPPGKRPDLAIVLIDCDDDRSRKARLDKETSDRGTRVIGVAIQEFEAWLIADETAVSRVVRKTLPTPRDPEQMQCRDAKEWLAQALDDADDPAGARRAIAEAADLERISARCPAFRDFRRELARAVALP